MGTNFPTVRRDKIRPSQKGKKYDKSTENLTSFLSRACMMIKQSFEKELFSIPRPRSPSLSLPIQDRESGKGKRDKTLASITLKGFPSSSLSPFPPTSVPEMQRRRI